MAERINRVREKRRAAYSFAFCTTHIERFMAEGKPVGCSYCENERLQAEVERLRQTFGHTHVAGQQGDLDRCESCGLDLRDPIHQRLPTKGRRECGLCGQPEGGLHSEGCDFFGHVDDRELASEKDTEHE